MISCPRTSHDTVQALVSGLLALLTLPGCSGNEQRPHVEEEPAASATLDPAPLHTADHAISAGKSTKPEAPTPEPPTQKTTAKTAAAGTSDAPEMPADKSAGEASSTAEGSVTGHTAAHPKLDELLAQLVIPPPWLQDAQTQYDTSKPWKDARLEIRRLLGLGRTETHREAIKLTWLYLQKGDIGDGHEYPMYTFLGGDPVWSIRAHEEFLAKPHQETPIHAHLTLAALYAQYGEFDKAKATLVVAQAGLPAPPWDIQRKADLAAAYGDLYAAWGKPDEAKRCYAEAVALYPTAKPPYGGHLLPRRAAQVQSKLDLLTFQSLQATDLRDGEYRDKALGYAGDIDVTVVIREGKIADIRLKHEEKIDQNACVLIPQRMIAAQSLQVDGISGATVTKDAIVHGVYRSLRKAGLR
jgi:uncharacterized protein with FMN-binding domain